MKEALLNRNATSAWCHDEYEKINNSCVPRFCLPTSQNDCWAPAVLNMASQITLFKICCLHEAIFVEKLYYWQSFPGRSLRQAFLGLEENYEALQLSERGGR